MDSGNGSEAAQPPPLAYERMAGHQPALPFADQRGGLKTMGLVLVVFGAISGCMAALTPLALIAPKVPGVAGVTPRDLVVGLAMYLLAAAMLITVGTGSFRVRRWSRPLILIITGIWAVSGILGFVSWLVFAPSMEKTVAAVQAQAAAAAKAGATTTTTAPATTMPATAAPPFPAPPAAMPRGFAVITGLLFVVFLILLPAGVFWFYSRQSVQQTLDYFDPAPAWTDRCPTPVLAISLLLALGALSTIALSFWGVVPAFGTLVSGPGAIAIWLAMGIILASLALAAYRVRPMAWWLTTLLVGISIASALVTFARIEPLEMYRLAGSTPEQLDLMQRIGALQRGPLLAQQSLYAAVTLAYLFWVRKFFRPVGNFPDSTA